MDLRLPQRQLVGGPPLQQSLISYWKTNEVSNGSVPVTRIDSVAATGNDLTDNNTVASGAGIVGNAASFIAVNTESLSRADNASLRVAGSFTIGVWINTTTVAPANHAILGRDAGGVNREYFLLLSASAPTFRIWNAAGSLKILSSSLVIVSINTWYYLVAWYDAVADTMNIQINDGTVESLGSIGGLFASAATPFTVGAFAGSGFWDGLIDEVGFWKRVLTAGERTSLYNAGAGFTYPF